MFKHTQIILTETSHPGNIGSVARAMKTMGLYNLVLVNPQTEINEKSFALASNAKDVLQQAKITKTIPEAILKSQLVIATSARKRNQRWSNITPREAAQLIYSNEKKGIQSSIIYGREKNGLSNEELKLANYLLYIPSNEAYNSLNLAMAVQILAYEIQVASQINNNQVSPIIEKPTSEETKNLHIHLEETLQKLNFFNTMTQKATMLKVVSMLNRMTPSKQEVQMLRGFLKKISRYLK